MMFSLPSEDGRKYKYLQLTMNINENISKSKTWILLFRTILFVLLGLFGIISCSKTDRHEASSEKEKDPGIHETYESGPASMTIDADKKEMTVAERLNLTISVVVDEDYEVTMPDLAGKLEKFGVVDWHTTQPELTDSKKKKITRSYVLEPFLSGDYAIPPMEVKFSKKGGGEAGGHSLSSSQITIKVNSILPADMKEMKLNDIKPPVPYPTDYRKWLLTGGCALILIAACVLTWIYIKRRRKMLDVPAVMLTPHEIAYKELDELSAENLVEKGEIKLYYQRVSGILRRYIENRFGLRAPEQTTEEFLAGLDMDRGLPENYKPLLKTFLRHCDLVKFAEFKPGYEDIIRAFESCKDFIRGTEEKGVEANAV
jgi:hypothetical protein